MTCSTVLSTISRLGLLVLVLSVACRDSNSPPQERAIPQKQTAARDTVVNYDSLLTVLLGLQAGILAHPEDLRRIPVLIEESFDTVSGSFLIAGRGVPNPKFPEASRDAARKSAALYDGKMWGLHLKKWRSGAIQPFTRPIAGEIAYSKVLFERLNGDTLCQLIQIPIGSIIVQ